MSSETVNKAQEVVKKLVVKFLSYRKILTKELNLIKLKKDYFNYVINITI